MKTDIHPTYYPKAKVTCACGATIEVGSTVEDIHTEICSNCHPFYTGKQKLIDTARRVDKFKKRAAAKDTLSKTRVGKKVKRARLSEKKEVKRADEAKAKKGK